MPADASLVLSGFAPDVNKLPRPQGEDVFLVHLAFSYSDARADIAGIVVTVVPPGSKVETTKSSAPSFGIKGASGKASYQASFYSTSPLGVHEYRLRLIDADGNQSAEASAKVELTASGTSRLPVTSMSPASGAVGELLTLTGTGLDAASIAHTAVSIAGVRSEIRKITGGRILCAVPDSVLTGPVVISNTRGVVRSARNFTASPSLEVAEDGKPILLPLETKKIRAEVSGLADRSAHWYVNGIAGGSTALGTIDQSGLYTAPASSTAFTTARYSWTRRAGWPRIAADASICLAGVSSTCRYSSSNQLDATLYLARPHVRHSEWAK